MPCYWSEMARWVQWGALAVLAQLLACGQDEIETSTVVTDAQAGTSGSGGSGATGPGGAGGSGAIAIDSAAGSAGSSSDAAGCGDLGDDADCTACLRQNCCSQAAACRSNAECSALVACASQCPSPADGTTPCVQTCARDHDTGISSFNAALLCMGRDCAPQCSRL